MHKEFTLTAITAGLAMVLIRLAASAIDGAIPGVLIKDTINELPVPDVAMALDCRSMVVWQDVIGALSALLDKRMVNKNKNMQNVSRTPPSVIQTRYTSL